MAESVKIATRESFGKALCELAKTHSDMQTFPLQQKQTSSQKNIQISLSTAVSQNVI